jgi:hypothetical protein
MVKNTRRADVRLGGKELFVYYHRGIGEDTRIRVGGCTNKRVLSRKTGVEYNTLMWVFTRKGLCYYEKEDIIILKLYTSDIEKGGQSMKRRGRGGMENFMRYVMGRENSGGY